MDLLEKIRKARESRINIDGHELTIRRPTDLEAITMRYSSTKDAIQSVARYVVGWDLQEIDIIPGGAPVKVPFDSDVFAEWINDQPEMWTPLISAVMEAYKRHRPSLEDAEKK